MTMPDLPQWHVLGDQIREETSLAESGTGLTQQYVVPFTIDSGPAKGHRGAVRVSPAEFQSPDRVREAIETWVHAGHQVAQLGNSGA